MPDLGQVSLAAGSPAGIRDAQTASESRRTQQTRCAWRAGCAWTALCVHVDAAIRQPGEYLAAIWWRLLGKRLRSRSRLSPLLGSSRQAYDLWLCRQAVCSPAGDVPTHEAGSRLRVIAIVDSLGDPVALDTTLRSLKAEHVQAIVLANTKVEGAQVAPSLADVWAAIEWDEAPWIMPLTAGDILETGAIAKYEAALAQSPAVLAYADDDLIDRKAQRSKPHFKPDWNSELFCHYDYVSGTAIMRAGRDDLTFLLGARDWVRALAEQAACAARPVHVREVLHHRRVRPQPRWPARPTKLEARLPSVSVIVPTRNRSDLLETCLGGLNQTNYPDLEVIVVDNDSDDPAALAYLDSLDPSRFRVLRHEGPFNFSAINNRAARMAHGQVLCLLNNDVEMLEPDWLSIMVQQSLRDDVGAVGAQLLYPDGRIQHAGVVLGVVGGAAHAHRLLAPDEEGYFWRHQLPQYVSAVTAACLVVRRDRFMAVGGFNTESFAVAFNDVDLCLRLNRKGWQSFYEPRSRLVHHESVSRGFDRDRMSAQRFAGELRALRRNWRTDAIVDPFHHPSLSQYSERFVVNL